MAVGSAAYLFLHPDCATLSIPLILSVSVIGFMAIQLAGLTSDILIMVVSNLGSLGNFMPRRKIELFIYIGWAIYLCQIGWDVYSTYTIFSPQVVTEQLTNCTSYSTALTIYKAVILSHWAVVVFLFAAFSCLMDPCGVCLLATKLRDIEDDLKELERKREARERIQSDEESAAVDTSVEGVHKVYINCSTWAYQCRRHHCHSPCSRRDQEISASKEKALGDMLNVFRVLFEGMDYTFLDLLSGFKLALIYHEKMRSAGKDPAGMMIRVRDQIRYTYIPTLLYSVVWGIQRTVEYLKDSAENYEPSESRVNEDAGPNEDIGPPDKVFSSWLIAYPLIHP